MLFLYRCACDLDSHKLPYIYTTIRTREANKHNVVFKENSIPDNLYNILKHCNSYNYLYS